MTVHNVPHTEDEAAKALLKEARALLKKDAERKFFDALFAGAASEDVTRSNAKALAALAASALAEAEKHKPGGIEVALLSGHDANEPESVVVAVNDDRPFLFDTALAAAITSGARIRAAFHPILEMNGKPISVIVLVVDANLSETAAKALTDNLTTSFIQGRDAVRDWQPMLARLKQAREGLAAHPPKGANIEEDLAFLDWLGDNYFTFLGARDYALHPDGEYGRLDPVPGSGLGALSDEEARVIRQSAERPALTAAVRAYLDQPEPLIVTKSNARSLVHRRAHMDYVGVKTFDKEGRFNGERRFVGLFTSSAYSLPTREVPLLRTKCAAVMARAGLAPASHDGKALAHILDTFPRDELFQISEDELFEIAMGILRLGGRPKVKLFLRFDRFDRFVSAILFAPRDHITGDLREKIHALLARALDGRMSASIPAIDDESALVRIHYIIGRNPGPRPHVDVRGLEQEIADAIKTWDDAFLEALSARHGHAEGLRRLNARAAQFTPGYRGVFSPAEAAADLEILESLALRQSGLKVEARAYREASDAHSALRLKLYVLGEVLPLSVSLPIFENLGLKVIAEDAYAVRFKRDDGWTEESAILDFQMERADGEAAGLEDIKKPLEDVFHAVLSGAAESDGFNRLVIGAGLDWRNVVILRMVAKFLRQAAFPFSQDYMEQALARNPAIAGLLTAFFHARLDPKSHSAPEAQRLWDAIENALAEVPSLDDDRIIRRFRNVIANILRTNFYQDGANVLAIKLDSGKLDELPAPRPWREIFVYSPQMEGVHLRFGKVARGGIRWSDRREDFRTEILGLVKAQQVKNAVIVPVGAKGGFYPKTMPANPTRDQFMNVGVAAYKMLINALLDVTDNLKADGQVVPPPQTVRHDEDDPYLVVAADKGTATFSDIANGIAESRGFWLGDAFASGGSHGYDHKKMGITARGAWEAVKRHFREMGRDIQNEDFTVVGVGDMSGDVFGNGMLLSPTLQLIAAFDHRHILIDPTPDAAASFAERRRLFELPRSSWADYNAELLSPGGGIWPRSAKLIKLSDQVRSALGIAAAQLSPNELMRAILKAPVDLLWNGGIGTYIKASTQSHGEVGDRANDAIRVDGRDVRAKIIGEGGNLGCTQLGRIEYALQGAGGAGGRINTDAIDNAGGVHTSDREVNIKIVVNAAMLAGALTLESRDALLASMTDDIAAFVLRDNYVQSGAISLLSANAAARLDDHAELMRMLEREGLLNRAIEYLPDEDQLKERRSRGLGLTRPELAVLVAYSKISLKEAILKSAVPDDPFFVRDLLANFPPALLAPFREALAAHQLKREIIATILSNALVNRMGAGFAQLWADDHGLSRAEVIKAYATAHEIFRGDGYWRAIDALDNQVPAALQVRLMNHAIGLLKHATGWFAGSRWAALPVTDAVQRFGSAVGEVEALLPDALPPVYREEWDRIAAGLRGEGVPAVLAAKLANTKALGGALDIAELAEAAGLPLVEAAAGYFQLGERLRLPWLIGAITELPAAGKWQSLSRVNLRDDTWQLHRQLAAEVLAFPGADAAARVDAWMKTRERRVRVALDRLAELQAAGTRDYAGLAVAVREIAALSEPGLPR